MALIPHQLIFTVSDIDRAEAFYSHLLGIPGRRSSPGRHHFDCGGLILTCYDPGAEGESSDLSSAPHQVNFVVGDLEAVLDRAKEVGCTSLDEQIVTKPWGDRSFSVADPFENSIGFVDEMTLQRQMGSDAIGGPNNHIRVGLELSIQSDQGGPENQLVAAVVRIFKDEIWLKLAEPARDFLFKEGEQVQIQYRNEQAAFSSETEIIKVTPSENRYVAISMPEEAEILQRRAAPRVCVELPLSFSILSAAVTELVSEEVFDSQTYDISTSGLRFETSLPLKAEDQLQLELLLPASQGVGGTVKVAWSKQVKREGKTLTSVGARFVELHLGEQIKLLQYFLGRVQDPETNGSDQPHSLTLGEQRETNGSDRPHSLTLGEQRETNGSDQPHSLTLGEQKETPSSPALIKSKEEQVKPAIPTVQAVPSVQSGRIFLAFHNGYRRPVTVNAVAVIHGAECLNLMKANGGGDLPANAKIHYPLLDESRQLVPGGTERVDITDKLFSLFNEWWWRFKGNGDQVSERQRSATRTRMIGIGLTLESQPLSQPEQTYYRVTLDNGDFTSVSPAHDGNRKQERVAYPGGFTKLALRD